MEHEPIPSEDGEALIARAQVIIQRFRTDDYREVPPSVIPELPEEHEFYELYRDVNVEEAERVLSADSTALESLGPLAQNLQGYIALAKDQPTKAFYHFSKARQENLARGQIPESLWSTFDLRIAISIESDWKSARLGSLIDDRLRGLHDRWREVMLKIGLEGDHSKIDPENLKTMEAELNQWVQYQHLATWDRYLLMVDTAVAELGTAGRSVDDEFYYPYDIFTKKRPQRISRKTRSVLRRDNRQRKRSKKTARTQFLSVLSEIGEQESITAIEASFSLQALWYAQGWKFSHGRSRDRILDDLNRDQFSEMMKSPQRMEDYEEADAGSPTRQSFKAWKKRWR